MHPTAEHWPGPGGRLEPVRQVCDRVPGVAAAAAVPQGLGRRRSESALNLNRDVGYLGLSHGPGAAVTVPGPTAAAAAR